MKKLRQIIDGCVLRIGKPKMVYFCVGAIVFLALVVITIVLTSDTAQSQSTYSGYGPVVKSRIIAEFNSFGCRWPHSPGATTFLLYKWGSNLQNPGTAYRNAFESSIVDWNAVATKMRFSYSNSSGSIILNTYNDPGGAAGVSEKVCSGSNTTGFNIDVNIAGSSGSTANQKRAVTGHELGHSMSVFHIPGKDFNVLMGYNPNNTVYYSPQQADVDWVNQFYP